MLTRPTLTRPKLAGLQFPASTLAVLPVLQREAPLTARQLAGRLGETLGQPVSHTSLCNVLRSLEAAGLALCHEGGRVGEPAPEPGRFQAPHVWFAAPLPR